MKKNVLICSVLPNSNTWSKFDKVVQVSSDCIRWYWPGNSACPECNKSMGPSVTIDSDENLENLNFVDYGLKKNFFWGYESRIENGRINLSPFYRDPTCAACHPEALVQATHSTFLTRFYEENTRLTRAPRLFKNSRPHQPQLPSAEFDKVEPKARTELERLIKNRRSIRSLDPKATISKLDLVRSLQFSCGIMNEQGQRAAPSGGALYAITAFVLVNHCTDITPGLYEYSYLTNSLVPSGTNSTMEEVHRNFGYPEITNHASAIVILVGNLSIVCDVYQSRGYRLLLLEAGHIAQNLLLLATEHEWSGCPLLAFCDEFISQLLSTEKVNLTPLYAIALGRK